MANLKISRRDLFKGVGAGAAALGGSSLLPRGAVARDDELKIFVWSGYSSDPVTSRFADEFDTSVTYELLTSDPDAVNRLRAGEKDIWHIINLNNPWAREWMYPEGTIVPLNTERFRPYYEGDKVFKEFHHPYKWAMDLEFKEMLGIVQRIGTFTYVVNTDKISRRTAESEGWALFDGLKDRMAVLTWDNWNISHMCLGAGLNPYAEKSESDLAAFEKTSRLWFNNSAILSDDYFLLNNAMLNGEIDAYVSGSSYTTSTPRLEGYNNFWGTVPESGPVDGKGGIMWIEITSVVNNGVDPTGRAEDFLEYCLSPELSAIIGQDEDGMTNVAQMSDPECMKHWAPENLNAVQADGLQWEFDHSFDMYINPNYDQMFDIYTSAKRERESV